MISAIILTKNQTDLLKVCLESIKWVDEIIIVDDDSIADVVSVIKNYTDKIFVHTLTDFSSQRNFAAEQAKGDWILFVDPDERVTQSLRSDIESAIKSGTSDVAFAIPRQNYYLGQRQKFLGASPDYVIRLMQKAKFQGYEGTLHEQPKFDGSLGYLKNPFIHLTHRDISSMTLKTLAWSTMEAKLRLNSGHPKMSSIRFFRVLITTFFDWYFIKGGWRSGTTGTIESIFQTFSVFMTYVKLWEMQQNPSLEEQYREIDQKLIDTNFENI